MDELIKCDNLLQRPRVVEAYKLLTGGTLGHDILEHFGRYRCQKCGMDYPAYECNQCPDSVIEKVAFEMRDACVGYTGEYALHHPSTLWLTKLREIINLQDPSVMQIAKPKHWIIAAVLAVESGL